ncbi:MAG: hypothetical protein ACRC0Y_07795 [Fusobacteriaceae bacterium]
MTGNVMLFIFEGTSDNTTLAPYIDELIKECKLSLTVEIIRGDNTSAWVKEDGKKIKNKFKWTPSTIRQDMIGLIKNHISKNSSIPNLKLKDIYKIYYVTDTDDCFQYPEMLDKVNKSRCMKSIFGFDKLTLAPSVERRIELIFFARDLEHVTIHNEIELTGEEKNKLALQFSEDVFINEGLFEYTFIKNELKIWDTYSDSYKGITKYVGRACNMNNLLEEISILRKEKLELLEKEIEKKSEVLTTVKAKKELENLNKQLKIKNKEKDGLKRIIEKRKNMLNTYLENNPQE